MSPTKITVIIEHEGKTYKEEKELQVSQSEPGTVETHEQVISTMDALGDGLGEVLDKIAATAYTRCIIDHRHSHTDKSGNYLDLDTAFTPHEQQAPKD